jgi:hypothetical protein
MRVRSTTSFGRLPLFSAFLLAAIPGITAAQQSRDSVEARRRAERAQARFEQVRRQNLPRRYSGSGGNCDARIGRFCQWNADDDTVEAKDPRVIRRARLGLLATLDSLAKKSPRDGWIAGQRVRYLLEIENDTAALGVARDCKAARWWCSALEGLALQQKWNGSAADSAFARALREMPASERCRWTDMTPIIDYSVRKRFGKVGCGKNEALAERLWWVADPFWSLDGNDRRTEHYARHTMAKIFEPARIVYNLSWANDLREMIVRYGWARYWTMGYPPALDPFGGVVSGHEATPNYHFVPVALSSDSAPSVSYDLGMDASAERYAPVIARRLVEIDPQVAVFRRGDSALVVAAYDVARRREFDSAAVTAGLVVAHDERAPMYQDSTSGFASSMSVLVDPRPQMMSVEVVDLTGHRAAAWKRMPLNLAPMPAGISMSDVLLFDPAEREVSTVDSAMITALGSSTVPRAKVGIYWETYGLARTDSAMPVSLTLTRVSQGALRRLGESIGLASKTNPLSIRWTQTMSLASVTSRSVVLDLSLVPRGKYQLRIDAGPEGKPVATTAKLIELQ